MMMGGGESEKQRSVVLWKLKVCVRAERFSLKLNLRNRLSSWKLHRLSFVLRFRNHHLKVDSQSKPRFIRSLAIFRRRRRRESVDAKKLMELVWNGAVVVAKKARGVGAAVTLIIIVANYLMPWIKLSTEPFQLY